MKKNKWDKSINLLKRRDFLKSLAALAVFGGSRRLWTVDRINHSSEFKKPPQMEASSKSLLSSVHERPIVVQVKDLRSTYWDGSSYPYVDYINQKMVDQMLESGLRALTGEKTAIAAWKAIVPYKTGEKIAIKPNLNDLFKEFQYYVVAPQVINAVIKGLIESLRVPPKNIIVYDVSRLIPDTFRKRIFYDVTYVEPFGSNLQRKIKYHLFGNSLAVADPNAPVTLRDSIRNKKGQAVKCFLPKCLTICNHLINIPLFKSHQFVLASGSLKNHYGTIRFSDGNLNPEYLHPPIIHECIADLNAHPFIKSHTRLIVMDALFGRVYQKHGPPDLRMNSLFVSRDPVALDSVSSSLIRKQLMLRGVEPFSDRYLDLSTEAKIGIHERVEDGNVYKRINFQNIDLDIRNI